MLRVSKTDCILINVRIGVSEDVTPLLRVNEVGKMPTYHKFCSQDRNGKYRAGHGEKYGGVLEK